MLAAPTKKGKSADWGAPLRAYISQTYGEKTADEQTENLAKLNTSREWVLTNASKANAESLTNVKSYLRMLGAVEARFPVREGEVNLSFTWYDSFKPQKKFTHHRLEAERSAVLFNYAAMESYAGMTQDRTQPEGLQQALQHFLTAARYFFFLRDVYLPVRMQGPVTSDMTQEGLTMLGTLMLAQAQACYFEKGVKNKFSPSVLSKLGSGASELYRGALAAAQSENLNAILDKTWPAHLDFQMKCFEASAMFQYTKVLLASADEKGEGYGERIAYLKASFGKCAAAIATAQSESLPGNLVVAVETLQKTVNKDLQKAISDNSAIYMDVIPQETSLLPVPSHILAKADLEKVDKTLTDPIYPGVEITEADIGAELFKELLPSEIQTAVALFQSRISDLVERTGKLLSNKEKEVKSLLESANLPAAIEAGGGLRGVPEAIWTKVVDNVQAKGGYSGLKTSLSSNAKTAIEIEKVILSAEEKLKADEAADLQKRQIWNVNWTLPIANEVNSLMKKDCARFKGYLAEARESDKLLLQRIDSVQLKKLLEDLSLPREQMNRLIPDPGVVDDDPAVENLRSNLRMSYIKLQTELQKGSSVMEDLRYKTDKASIVQDLYVKDTSITELVGNEARLNKIMDDKMDEFTEPANAVEKLVDSLSPLLARVIDDNSKYLSARRENAATREREKAVSRIESGIDQYLTLEKHLSEGKKFYASLAEKVNRMNSLIEGHCLSRDLMARELEQNLMQQAQANRLNVGGMNPNGFQAPVTQPFQGQVYNNPGAMMQQIPTMVHPATLNSVAPIAANLHYPSSVATAATPMVNRAASPSILTPNPAAASSSGGSLYEQMIRAQEAAERDGTIGLLTGMSSPTPAASAPAVSPTHASPNSNNAPYPNTSATTDDAMAAAAEALRLEQEEIYERIKLREVIDKQRHQDYTKELNDLKQVFQGQYPDDLILGHLKETNGNTDLTTQRLLDGVPLKKQKGMFGGIFGRGSKNKAKTPGNGGAAPW